jgi:hypothetical protein
MPKRKRTERPPAGLARKLNCRVSLAPKSLAGPWPVFSRGLSTRALAAVLAAVWPHLTERQRREVSELVAPGE